MAKRKPKNNKYLSLGLIVFGIFLTSLSITHFYLKERSLSLDKELVETYSPPTAVMGIIPTHIKIPWFIDVAVASNLYHEGRWTTSDTEASYLLNSARPGNSGNTIIYGHNTRAILGNIRALKGNEIITLSLSNGKTIDYQVISLTQVNPNDVSYLMPTKVPTLTLYTCAGFLDSERFIVQAHPVTAQVGQDASREF